MLHDAEAISMRPKRTRFGAVGLVGARHVARSDFATAASSWSSIVWRAMSKPWGRISFLDEQDAVTMLFKGFPLNFMGKGGISMDLEERPCFAKEVIRSRSSS